MKTYLKMKGLISILALVMVGALGIGSASATTLYMNYMFSGETPLYAGTGPNSSWVTADLTSSGSGSSWTNTLVLTSFLTNGMFVGGNATSDLIGWAFNLSSYSGLTASSCSGSYCASALNFGDANVKTAGSVPGPYNVGFYWTDPQNRFTDGETATYTWTSTASVNFLSTGGAGVSGLYSVVHIQGFGNGCSAWILNSGVTGATGGTITQCGTTSVPEPSELPMMALGAILMLGGWLWTRRRQIKVKV